MGLISQVLWAFGRGFSKRFQRLEQQALKKEEDDQNLLFLKFMDEPYDPKNPHTFSFDES